MRTITAQNNENWSHLYSCHIFTGHLSRFPFISQASLQIHQKENNFGFVIILCLFLNALTVTNIVIFLSRLINPKEGLLITDTDHI